MLIVKSKSRDSHISFHETELSVLALLGKTDKEGDFDPSGKRKAIAYITFLFCR